MRPSLLALLAAAVLATAASAAHAAAPTGFTPAATIATNLAVDGPVVASGASGALPGAIAFATTDGRIWAVRVLADGTLGSPLPAAEGQQVPRSLDVTVSEQGEVVVVWAAGGEVRWNIAPRGRSFAGTPRRLARVGSSTAATPQVAALRGGTIAVVFRDTDPRRGTGVLRYARRGPFSTFGPNRALGVDGIAPMIEPAPGGGALLAWGQGRYDRRALMVAAAQRGAGLPGRASSVAGRIRAFSLAASPDGTAWVTWTRRDAERTGAARRTRAGNRPAVGPVQELGPVAYGTPDASLGLDGATLVARTILDPPGEGTGVPVVARAARGSAATLTDLPAFGFGGFSQTSPAALLAAGRQLVLLTRQVPADGRAEIVAADAATGELTVLGSAASIDRPAVARAFDGAIVAWAAAGGGAAVRVLRPAALGG